MNGDRDRTRAIDSTNMYEYANAKICIYGTTRDVFSSVKSVSQGTHLRIIIDICFNFRSQLQAYTRAIPRRTTRSCGVLRSAGRSPADSNLASRVPLPDNVFLCRRVSWCTHRRTRNSRVRSLARSLARGHTHARAIRMHAHYHVARTRSPATGEGGERPNIPARFRTHPEAGASVVPTSHKKFAAGRT